MLRRDAITAFLAAAAETLDGRWVLLGGAVVALLLDPERGTEDIDLIPVPDSNEARLQLMAASEEAGLGVETVNTAAGYFLRRIPGWESDLVELLRIDDFVVSRPGPRLFVRTKGGRMNERDLADCLLMARAEGDGLDWTGVIDELRSRSETSDNEAATARREALIEALAAL